MVIDDRLCAKPRSNQKKTMNHTFAKATSREKCLVQFEVLFKSLCGTNGTFFVQCSGAKNFDEVATLTLIFEYVLAYPMRELVKITP